MRHPVTLAACLLFCLLSPPVTLAQSAAKHEIDHGVYPSSVPEAGLAALSFAASELNLNHDWAELGTLSADETGRLEDTTYPYRVVGVTRDFEPRPFFRVMAGAPAETNRGRTSTPSPTSFTWTVGLRSKGAAGVRVGVRLVGASPATVFVGSGLTAFGPLVLQPGEELLTPTVFSEEVVLEVRGSSTSDLEVQVTKIAHIVVNDLGATSEDASCLINALCATDYNHLTAHSSATSYYLVTRDGTVGQCTGGLLNDDGVEGFIPYFLTANHCIGAQVHASSAEFYFDAHTQYCGGPAPSLSNLPRVVGATLLSTAEDSDFAFLRLSSNPPQPVGGSRYYLGWDPRPIAFTLGKALHRISHPGGRIQNYSAHVVDTMLGTCSGTPRGDYIYALTSSGGIEGGSSGSLVQHEDQGSFYVVGQLSGGCGPDTSDPCNRLNLAADGAFATTWSYVQPWLRPSSTPSNYNLTVSRSGSGSGTVTSNPSGISCGSDCSQSYTSGTSVTLTASASSGSSFAGWSGACTGTGSTCTVLMNTNKGVTATFNVSSAPCSPTQARFCTQSNRFEVSLSARDPRTGKTDAGHVMSSSNFFGYFAFPVLAGNTTDPQVFVKVLDGRPINGKWWVFYASLTDVEFTLTVRDTQTGAVKTYRQQPYSQDAKNDINAF